MGTFVVGSRLVEEFVLPFEGFNSFDSHPRDRANVLSSELAPEVDYFLSSLPFIVLMIELSLTK